MLRTFDRYGNRIDEVEFHPAWHQLMTLGVEHELHSLPWTSERPFAHTARAALYMTAMQAEAGYCCPITMTFAVVPALRAQPRAGRRVGAAAHRPRAMTRARSRRLQKGSAICGMAMTEKQGGSDVRANTTVARALNGGGAGAEYELHRAQVVLLGADVRRVPRARADRRGALLLPAAAHPARTARATRSTSSA